MTLSVIIVNYNVKYFLEQCLHSLQKAAVGLRVEIIVVDNYSTDDSINYLQPKFPAVKFITNDSNIGFAKACNKGLRYASGEYILFLNPDTLIAEDTLKQSITFFKNHTDCGALGVCMIDGSGKFLKESKRSFPSPLTSLFKLFGLARLFPKSPVFSRYHLGNLDPKQNHVVDVLAGAYMMIQKKILQQVGSFDESFFMYGEDVDLSYRIQQAGFKNYYLAETQIIHFKGESTKRGSLNYVRLFYNAMSLFVKKHYGGTRAGFFNASIHFAIWIRAVMAAGAKFIKWIGLPVLDAAFILLSFWLVKEFWNTFIKTDIIYPNLLLQIAFPAFTLIYLIVAYYTGLYDKSYRAIVLVRSTLIAMLVLLALYALLPENYRFSRGIVVFGALLAFVLISWLRWVLLQAKVLQQPIDKINKPYILVAGSKAEFDEVKQLLQQRNLEDKITGRIAVNEYDSNTVASINNISEIAMALNAQEIVFCAGCLSYKHIISLSQHLSSALRLRFHAANSSSIIGSDSSTGSGETITTETTFNLAKSSYRRVKRLIDFLVAVLSLLFFPIPLLVVRKPFYFFQYCYAVLFAKKTWVGYITTNKQLPSVKPAVVGSNGLSLHTKQTLPLENLQLLDYWYARDYQPIYDIKIILKNYKHLGD